MKRLRALIVEDEPAISELLAINLRHSGFEPIVCMDGEQAQREIDSALPDIVLLDWMLPATSGISLAKKWRSDARTRELPILLLTARSAEADKIQGLDAGADDYLTKPFSTQELMARIRALLRRKAPAQTSQTFHIDALTLDEATHRVTWQSHEIKLGPTEFKLLRYMMAHPERVHSRAQLLDQVWGDQVFIEERTVDVHIKRLREALKEASAMIDTVRGAGYRITAKPQRSTPQP